MDGNTIFREKEESNIEPGVFEPPSSFSSSKNTIFKFVIGALIFFVVSFIFFGFLLPKIFQLVKREEIVLVYWGINKEEEILRPILDEFERENRNIKIEYSNQEKSQYRERLTTRIDNGTGPDVFSFHNTWLSMLGESLLPLPTTVINKEDFSSNFYPVVKSDLVKNGALYGIPLWIDVLSLYVNIDLFRASGILPPSNWVDFQNYARLLTVKDESNRIITSGAAMGTSNNINHAPDIVSMLISQNGVSLRNISNNLESCADALNFYTSFAIPSLQNVWDETLESSLRSFANGTLAMYFGYSQDNAIIKSINPNLSFEIHPLPQLPGQNTTIASYWAEGVSSKSRHPKEALLFIKYLSKKETLKKFEGMSLATAENAISSFMVDETFDDGLNTKSNEHLKNAIDSILQGSTPLSSAETLGTGISEVLQEYPN